MVCMPSGPLEASDLGQSGVALVKLEVLPWASKAAEKHLRAKI